MNKVQSIKKSALHKASRGDIYQDQDGLFYILAMYGIVDKYKYVAICLNTGLFWTKPKEVVEDAVEGLEFVAYEVDIQINW